MESTTKIQSRREFFKSAAKKALPILGAIVLMSVPTLNAQPMQDAGCECQGACGSKCNGSCYYECNNRCYNTCKDTCSNGCKETCSCCSGSCKGYCDGGCQGR